MQSAFMPKIIGPALCKGMTYKRLVHRFKAESNVQLDKALQLHKKNSPRTPVGQDK